MSTSSLVEKIGFTSSFSRAFWPARWSGVTLGDASAPVDAMPPMPYNWTLIPFLSTPGQTRKYLTLPDEILAHYGEQYLLFIAPWKHLVGTEMPNFYQFIAWHEQMSRPHKAPVEKPS